VRAKKAQMPRQSIRYLLYADKALQRISLRRISVRVKKANKPQRARQVKKAASGKTASRKTHSPRKAAQAVPVNHASQSLNRTDPWWIAFAVVCAAGIIVLVGVPSGSKLADRASTSVEMGSSVPGEDAAMGRLDTMKPVSKASAMNAGTATRTPNSSSASRRAADPARKPADDPAASARPTTIADGQNATLVTIQGCLQAGDDTFWLKDTSGEGAPQSRSWRSGFLRKRSAPVEVIDADDALNLSKFVGQRVAASGTVADRRMVAHSLQRLAASCN
jgi:hypothetical protein